MTYNRITFDWPIKIKRFFNFLVIWILILTEIVDRHPHTCSKTLTSIALLLMLWPYK